MNSTLYKLGAQWLGNGQTHFLVWAPLVQSLEVHLLRDNRRIGLTKDAKGYFYGLVDNVQIGESYFYSIDHLRERPDPATRFQPDGVHGPSRISYSPFVWTDAGFMPPTLRNTVFYEIHIGTMTSEGTFRTLIDHLPHLYELGITTLEIMPIAQCPGTRNWGYDGVQIYAPYNAYGPPEDFKALVNAAHENGLAVFLDVVYNHLGPEGNYLWDYGPYFTNRYKGVWGDSLNFDGRGSDEVRRYFIDNAIYWLDEFHVDGLRLDATQAMIDLSAVPFLEDLTMQVHAWAEAHNRRIYLVAETDRSDRKLVLPREVGGVGLDGQWLDDFHHTVHTALTGETFGYYEDYIDFSKLVKVLRTRFSSTGEYSSVAGRKLGTDASDIPADRFVVAVQTHDQVGNRMLGDRLMPRSGFEAAKLSAGYLLTSPYVPMIFMGQEYGELAPFLFFTGFTDEALIEAVRQGRKADYAYFFEAQGEPPDPQAESTFLRSKLNHDLRHQGVHEQLYNLHHALLTLRRSTPALTNPDPAATTVYTESASSRLVCVERRAASQVVRIVLNWNFEGTQSFIMPPSEYHWAKVFDSSHARWQINGRDGSTTPDKLSEGSPMISLPACSFVVYLASD